MKQYENQIFRGNSGILIGADATKKASKRIGEQRLICDDLLLAIDDAVEECTQ